MKKSSEILHPLILSLLAMSTSQDPMPLETLKQTIAERGVGVPEELRQPSAILEALEALEAESLVTSCAVTTDGATRLVYWPIGSAPRPFSFPSPPPRKHEPAMPSTSDKFIRAIEKQGPIIRADLFEATGLPNTTNIEGHLKGPLSRGEIVTRQGYVADRGRNLVHFMTREQAKTWDAEQSGNDSDTKESGDGIHVNETAAENCQPHLVELGLVELVQDLGAKGVLEAKERIAKLLHGETESRRRLHDLGNDIAAANLVLNNLAAKLQVQRHEDIPQALDELLDALCTRAAVASKPSPHAVLLIDSADLIDFELLPNGSPIEDARAAAERAVNEGHAARAVLIHVLGEARRKVEWSDSL